MQVVEDANLRTSLKELSRKLNAKAAIIIPFKMHTQAETRSIIKTIDATTTAVRLSNLVIMCARKHAEGLCVCEVR